MRHSERPTRATERSWAAAAMAMLSSRATLVAKHDTAMRPSKRPSRPISPARAPSASDPEWPLVKTLVESPDQGQDSLLAQTAKRLEIGGQAPAAGRGIELPSRRLWDHGARRSADGQHVGLGDGMGDRDHLHLSNGPTVKRPPNSTTCSGHLVVEPGLVQLAAQAAARPRTASPKSDSAGGPTGTGRPPGGPRARWVSTSPTSLSRRSSIQAGSAHHHVDHGHGFVAEGDAAIHHQPPVAIAVQRQIHADLADTAQGQEIELSLPHARTGGGIEAVNLQQAAQGSGRRPGRR